MDSTINTGILSFGMSGRLFHAPFVHAHTGFELKAVTERSDKQAAQIYPGIKSYDSVDALLEDDTLDLVIVNTPNATHFDFAMKALQKGRHVLVEKPFTTTPGQAKELFEVAGNNGLHVLPYQNRRYDSDFLSVKKVLDSGKLGNLIEVHFRFDRYRDGIGPKLFKETPGPAAGLLYDLGPHLIDQVISVFGIPLKWNKTLGHFRPDTRVDDYAHIHLTYPGGLQVFVTAGMLVADEKPAFTLNGRKGAYTKFRTDNQEIQLLNAVTPLDPNYGIEEAGSEGVLTTIPEDGKRKVEKIPAVRSSYMKLFEDVYQAIRNGEQYPVTPEHILAQLEILNG